MTDTSPKQTSEIESHTITFNSEGEVLQHHTKTGAEIIIYEGTVYDTSGYADGHPGGKDFISNLYGKSIDVAFADQEHSRSAKKILKDLPVVGHILGKTGDTEKNPQVVGEDGHEYESGALKVDYERGIFTQLWNRNDYTMAEYVQFINEPKHLINPVRCCRMFDSDFVEYFSKTPWWVIPVYYYPYLFYMLYLGQTMTFDAQVAPYWEQGLAFVVGWLVWTMAENLFHRFVFHAEDYWLPEWNKAMAMHWMMHGIHHTFPTDGMRLVFPVIPGTVLIAVVTMIPSYFLIPQPYTWIYMAGILQGYIAYDIVHYFYHHSSPKKGYFKTMKLHHMAHHYRNPHMGFGLTTKFWDTVFRTPL
jgi:4-hydroxysphinganine ceramide fatty acyl 2-hydroxylase